jgi:ATP-dependent DNA ligase
LDGEIYAGPGKLAEASNAVKNGHFHRGLRYFVFDAPDATGTWLKRISEAQNRIDGAFSVCVSGFEFGWLEDLFHFYQSIRRRGGEGVMIRNPAVLHYETGRTSNLLKITAQNESLFAA